VNGKIVLWSIALFFGCSILFRAVADATVGSSKGVAFAVQAAVRRRRGEAALLRVDKRW
jgi:hypothetical protein